MAHPLVYALLAGVAVGVALYTYFAPHSNPHQSNYHTYENRKSEYGNINITDTCPICLEDIEPNRRKRLDCGHMLHIKCFNDLTNHSKNCPTCRRPFRL